MSCSGKIIRFENYQQIAHYFQGAVIDADGREIPITDEMVQSACQQLAYSEQALYAHTKSTQQFALLSR